MGRKPKNVPYIGEVKVNITATSKERYERFIEIVKMIIMENVKRRLEEERKQKNLSEVNNETQGD
jgi:predicted MarR family transcription regulator